MPDLFHHPVPCELDNGQIKHTWDFSIGVLISIVITPIIYRTAVKPINIDTHDLIHSFQNLKKKTFLILVH